MEENEVVKQKSKKKKKKSFSKLIKKVPFAVKAVVVIIIASLLIVVGTLIPNNPDSEETVLNFGFKDVGELVTQEWYGRILEDCPKDRKLFNILSIPFTKSRLIFSLDVEVLASVNFEEIEYDISNTNEKVTITLPHSKVYKAYEVQHSFKAYLDEESWFSNINAIQQQELKDKIVEKGKKQALKSGILKKADENAKNIIRNMVRTNENTEKYEVEFKYK